MIGLSHVPARALQNPRPTTVSGTVNLIGPGTVLDKSGVVVWLTPLGDASAPVPEPSTRPRFRILQRGKRFVPRVLAIPAGSVVDFPNLDPILHNVFSLFEGRRFDLGLYEEGTSRGVTFKAPGVSYIFCNIHPEMSAVVVAVDSIYYATSTTAGVLTIPDVPHGRYRLSLWHDRFKPESVSVLPREITVSATASSLGTLTLVDAGRAPTTHKNKFGHDYTPPNATAPYGR